MQSLFCKSFSFTKLRASKEKSRSLSTDPTQNGIRMFVQLINLLIYTLCCYGEYSQARLSIRITFEIYKTDAQAKSIHRPKYVLKAP